MIEYDAETTKTLPCGGRLQLILEPIVGLENPGSCSLEDIVTDAKALAGSVLSLNNDSVSYPITEERADIARRRK